MTLVVAKVHSEGISLVADTKVTHEDGDVARNRQVFSNALPKLVILRDDVAVGIAGSNPHLVLPRLEKLRMSSPEEILEALKAETRASFVLATLDPTPRIWAVRRGSSVEATSASWCWVGDADAYEHFEQRYTEWPESLADVDFRLMSSMQWLLQYNPVETVGGYLSRIATTDSGFRYVADAERVGPDFLVGLIEVTSESSTIKLTVPSGGDATSYEIYTLVGETPTIGALAYYIPQAGIAWIFPQQPLGHVWTVSASSVSSVIELASERGQVLSAGRFQTG